MVWQQADVSGDKNSNSESAVYVANYLFLGQLCPPAHPPGGVEDSLVLRIEDDKGHCSAPGIHLGYLATWADER